MAETMLADLVFVLVVGAAATIIAYWLKQPVVLGYLVAGVLIGPHALGLVRDFGTIEQLAHLGIIFLMLGVGLEFDLKKLRNVGARAVVVAAVQIGVMLGAGYAAGRSLGWSPMDSIFLGAIISISSTVIIVKVLTEMGKLKEEYAQLAFGVLIIEDIAAIAMVSVLGALGATGVLAPGVLAATVASIAFFVFLFLAVGLVVVPRFIEAVERFRVEEVLLISVVGLAFASALLAERLGFSLALGAFLIGGVLAESRAGKRIEHHIVPVRDLFTATFFVAVGMMLRPSDLVTYAWPILIVTLVTIAGKFVGVGIGALIAGYDGRTSVKTAASMAQIGEFGFIIAGLGLTLGVVRPELHAVAVAVCAITSLTTPLLMRWGPRVADGLAPKVPGWIARPIDAYGRMARRGESGFAPAPDAHRARHGTRLLVYAAWTIGATLLAFLAAAHLSGVLASRAGLTHMQARVAVLCLFAVAAAPFLAAFQRAAEAYARARARSRAHTIRGIMRARPRDAQRGARRAGALGASALLAAAGAISVALVPMPMPHVAAGMAALLAGALHAVVPSRPRRAHEERALDVLLGDERSAASADAPPPVHAPFGVKLAEVRLDAGSPAAYATLGSLDVGRQGAKVLSLQRGDAHIADPHPATLLQPDDRLTLVGRPHHVEHAVRALHAPERRA
ncbi:MAG TPA: cation:proton antiporter [Candidatus Thermoplasmatota archaeon]|nr:cation:proton antiporter [Candidatus Thermoplasmatota archaeon]